MVPRATVVGTVEDQGKQRTCPHPARPGAHALRVGATVSRPALVTNGRGEPVGPWLVDRAVDNVRQVEQLHFHSLRHHLATLLIESGCDVKTVQARMRHGSARTTLDVYGHLWHDKDETTRTAIAGAIAARVASSAGILRAHCG